MFSREEILENYKESKFPTELFNESALGLKEFLFSNEPQKAIAQSTKDVKTLSQCYVLPWRIVQKNNMNNASNNYHNKQNEFSRGVNFTPKEPLIEININNIKKLYDRFLLPLDTCVIYLKNNYGNVTGPYNLEQLQNMYKSKKIDSSTEFRPIDLYIFKNFDSFTFQSLKKINEDNWIDMIIDNPLLQYTELFKDTQEILNVAKKRKNEVNEMKEKMKGIETEEKEKEIPNEEKIEAKIETKVDEDEGKWEVVGKKSKKNVKVKEEENANNIIGLQSKKSDVKINSDNLTKNNKTKKEYNSEELISKLKPKKVEEPKIEDPKVKEETKDENKEFKEVTSKKGKKKKKDKKQFEEVDIDVAFQIK